MLAHPDRCVNCPALNLGSRVRAYLSSCQRRGRASDRHMRTLTQIPTLTISTLAPNQTISPPFAAATPPYGVDRCRQPLTRAWPRSTSRTAATRSPVTVRAGYAAAVGTPYDDSIERLRVAARPERPAPPEMKPYLDKVRRHAYRVDDADVSGLLDAGFSEDEIFEQTVSVAVAGRPYAFGDCAPGAPVRLAVVDGGHAPAEASVLDAMRERFGREPTGVVKTLHYRPDLFGRPFSDALQLALRGPSEWSPGERELFAGLHLPPQQLPLLNTGPRRGRVVRARRGDVERGRRRLAVCSAVTAVARDLGVPREDDARARQARYR